MITTLENKPRSLAHIRSAIYGQPWAITDAGLKLIVGIVESHVAGNPVTFQSQAEDDAEPEWDLGFDLINNVAIVSVEGPIIPKSPWFSKMSGLTSLESLRETVTLATSLKPNALVLNCDSPGGSVQGLADFCDWFHDLVHSTVTPVIGLVNPMAASACFMIASQCDLLLSTTGGMSGSIGTICVVDNWDRADRNAGNDPTVFRSSELKGVGNGPMSVNQQSEMQRMLMAHDAKFQQAVKRGRPNIDLSQADPAKMYHGQSANSDPSAVDMGLVDGISTLEKLIAQYGTK